MRPVTNRFTRRSQTLVLVLLALVSVFGCRTVREAAQLQRFEFEQPQMGVPFRIVLYADSENHANSFARAAFARVAELNHVFSDYEDDSELTLLSRTSGSGRAVPVSEELWRLLNVAQAMSRRSDGSFDITVGPLVQVWRRARRHRRPRRIPQRPGRVNPSG